MKPDRIAFTVLYYNGGPDHAPNRVIGREIVRRHDLTDAITFAANRMKKGAAPADGAHGFYVRKSNAYELENEHR